MKLAGMDANSNLPLFRSLVFHKSNATLRDRKISYTSLREILKNALKQLGFNRVITVFIV